MTVMIVVVIGVIVRRIFVVFRRFSRIIWQAAAVTRKSVMSCCLGMSMQSVGVA